MININYGLLSRTVNAKSTGFVINGKDYKFSMPNGGFAVDLNYYFSFYVGSSLPQIEKIMKLFNETIKNMTDQAYYLTFETSIKDFASQSIPVIENAKCDEF
jgi:hypothetical protein